MEAGGGTSCDRLSILFKGSITTPDLFMLGIKDYHPIDGCQCNTLASSFWLYCDGLASYRPISNDLTCYMSLIEVLSFCIP